MPCGLQLEASGEQWPGTKWGWFWTFWVRRTSTLSTFWKWCICYRREIRSGGKIRWGIKKQIQFSYCNFLVQLKSRISRVDWLIQKKVREKNLGEKTHSCEWRKGLGKVIKKKTREKKGDFSVRDCVKTGSFVSGLHFTSRFCLD